MTVYTLQLPQTDGQAFSIRRVLSGVEYRFDFYFNERSDTWSFNISDAGGDSIAAGCSCELDYDPLAFVSDNRLPEGLILFTDTGGQKVPAGRDDLGARVKMIYDDLIDANA